MSDFDNITEDRYIDRQEREEEARDVAIEFHRENWMTAVTQSVEKSNGTFKDVRRYKGENFNFECFKSPANSVDVFVEELHNLYFIERAARILIDLKNGRWATSQEDINSLFDDMAANHAEYKHEKSLNGETS